MVDALQTVTARSAVNQQTNVTFASETGARSSAPTPKPKKRSDGKAPCIGLVLETMFLETLQATFTG